MKTLSKIGMIAALGASLFLSSCAGEYYVSDQPADVVYEKASCALGEGAVWIEGDCGLERWQHTFILSVVIGSMAT